MHAGYAKHKRCTRLHQTVKTIPASPLRGRVKKAYRDLFDTDSLDDERREALAEIVWKEEDDLEHRCPSSVNVDRLHAIRMRLYDDLRWNEYQTLK